MGLPAALEFLCLETSEKSLVNIVPELIPELRSESDGLAALRETMELWIANGVDVAWLIGPYERAVTIYRPGDSPAHMVHPDSVQGSAPISGFELILSTIWPEWGSSAD
jgi:Uma2 family endonuclease